MKATLVMLWDRKDSAYIQAEADGIGAFARTAMFWIDQAREGRACVYQLTEALRGMGYTVDDSALPENLRLNDENRSA